jgi:hypothetical protein
MIAADSRAHPASAGRAPRRISTFTAGTLFASHKPCVAIWTAIAIFCNEVKNASSFSRDLRVSYKCAFVLLHKLREAMADELKAALSAGKARRRSRWRLRQTCQCQSKSP